MTKLFPGRAVNGPDGLMGINEGRSNGKREDERGQSDREETNKEERMNDNLQ
jgi:hypothetical protein